MNTLEELLGSVVELTADLAGLAASFRAAKA